MATVIGIFQNQFELKKPLTIVKPGSQTRRFTPQMLCDYCIYAWRKINAHIIVF